jgi:hypothetical protein
MAKEQQKLRKSRGHITSDLLASSNEMELQLNLQDGRALEPLCSHPLRVKQEVLFFAFSISSYSILFAK